MFNLTEIYKKEFDENFELIQINDEEDLTEENKNYNLVHVPTSIVLISKFFYYDLLKECASKQVSYKKKPK